MKHSVTTREYGDIPGIIKSPKVTPWNAFSPPFSTPEEYCARIDAYISGKATSLWGDAEGKINKNAVVQS